MKRSIIIFGGSGVGKTTFCCTVTKPELTRVIAFEGVQEGVIPEGVDVRDVMEAYDPFRPESVERIQDKLGRELTAAARDASAGKLRVLVLDGLNALHEAALLYSMEKEPNSMQRRAVLEQHIVRPVMLFLKRFPGLLFVTAHEASRYDRSDGSKKEPIGTQAALGGGGLRDKLGSYVDDIWHMTSTGKERRFTTQGTSDHGPEAKSRLKGPDGQPLLPARNVPAAEAAKALRLYMGWTKLAQTPAEQ